MRQLSVSNVPETSEIVPSGRFYRVMRPRIRPSVGMAGVLLLLSFPLGCGRKEAPPPPVAKISPPPVSAPEDPAPASDSIAALAPSAVEAESDGLKAALLGLNKHAAPAAEADPDARPAVRSRARGRRAKKTTAEEAGSVMGFPEIPERPDLSDYQFQEAVNSWRGMRNCLARSTLRGTDRSGAMRVAFHIRGDGSVSKSEVVETSNTVAATIAPCVERAARRIRFPAFGGQEVEKLAKFVF